MAIHSAGCCDYTVTLDRGSSSSILAGQAEPSSDTGAHPGMCGERPFMSIEGTSIVMRAASATTRGAHEFDRVPRAAEVRLDVGPMISNAVAAGDTLNVFRRATGDWGIAVFSGVDLRLAVGAVGTAKLRGPIRIEEDPRTDEECPALESLSGGSRRFVDTDSRFADAGQWLAYIRGLPHERPSDLWIRIHIMSAITEIRARTYAYVAPWHMYVEWIREWGLPGELSQFAVVRDQEGVTRSAVIDSTQLMASGRYTIRQNDKSFR